IGAGQRHCKPGFKVFVYAPKRVTTATCPSCTMVKPLANHKPTATTPPMTNSLGEPLGRDGPVPLPGGVPPGGERRPFLPNKDPRRLLKSRHTSSRSGGPSCFSGRRGGSEPFLPLSRPQPGSLRLNILLFRRIVFREMT